MARMLCGLKRLPFDCETNRSLLLVNHLGHSTGENRRRKGDHRPTLRINLNHDSTKGSITGNSSQGKSKRKRDGPGSKLRSTEGSPAWRNLLSARQQHWLIDIGNPNSFSQGANTCAIRMVAYCPQYAGKGPFFRVDAQTPFDLHERGSFRCISSIPRPPRRRVAMGTGTTHPFRTRPPGGGAGSWETLK